MSTKRTNYLHEHSKDLFYAIHIIVYTTIKVIENICNQINLDQEAMNNKNQKLHKPREKDSFHLSITTYNAKTTRSVELRI